MLIFFVAGAIFYFLYSLVQNALLSSSGGTTAADCATAYQQNMDLEKYQTCRRDSTLGAANGFSLVGALLATALSGAVLGIYDYFVRANIARGALLIADGKKVTVKDFLSADKLVPVVLGGILVGIATFIGLLLCIIPGIIVAFFAQFYVYFIMDKNMGAVESIKASFSFVKENFGQLILFFLASMVAIFIGALLCGVGLLVAYPVVFLANGFVYRKLQNPPGLVTA